MLSCVVSQKRWMKCVLALSCTIAVISGMFQPAFAELPDGVAVQLEKPVGTAGSYDPEYDQETGQVTFLSAGLKAWLADVNPATGQYEPSNGHGTLLGDADIPPSLAINGPQFGKSNGKTAVYFTSKGSNGHYQLFRFRDGKTIQLTHYEKDFSGNLPSTALTGPALIAGQLKDPDSGTIQSVIVNEDDPENPHVAPKPAIFPPFWVPESHLMGTTIYDQNGVSQIALYNTDSGSLTQVTTGPGVKSQPTFFYAPEFGNELLLCAAVDSTRYNIYRKIQGRWTLLSIIPAPFGTIVSPETLTYKGQSFIISLVRPGRNDDKPSMIYLFSLNGNLALPVSKETDIFRGDPESYVSNGIMNIYYYTSNGQNFISRVILSGSALNDGNLARSSKTKPKPNRKKLTSGKKTIPSPAAKKQQAALPKKGQPMRQHGVMIYMGSK